MKSNQVCYVAESVRDDAEALAKRLDLKCCDLAHATSDYVLVVTPDRLELRDLSPRAPGPVYVDFLSGAVAHRHEFGGGKGQLIARAVGLQRYSNVTLLDLTAGLGRDAFVLATLGCHVTMLERSPVVAALLEDGMRRARQESWFNDLKLQLVQTEAQAYLKQLRKEEFPDVIYLDPMYPERKKSALVKKEMRMLRQVVGEDYDADDLLVSALSCVKRRVVVKRPRLAEPLTGPKPDVIFNGKSGRFDVYIHFT